jgi:hypothetical protein
MRPASCGERRCQGLLSALLTGLALVTAGCSLNANTTTTNTGNCVAQGGNNSLCNQPGAGISDSSPGPSTPTVAGYPDGKVLGSYNLTMGVGDYYPIGPNHPTESQVSSGTAVGDLIYQSNAGSTAITPVQGQSAMAPFTGTPTYQGCLNDTDVQADGGGVYSIGIETAFCLYESGNGIIAGGVVTYINPTQINPDSVNVEITVWGNSS